ncbi:MAG: DNA-binding protein WhiA [Clostridia bacterium]|nr:DNA-binding protein WhiA [Clostridia bacterium]
MSFSSEIKEKISAETYKSTCCRKAFINGVLSSKARSENGVVSFNIENASLAAALAKYIVEFYGKEPTVGVPKSGGRCRVVTFESKAADRYLESLANGAPLLAARCPNCQSAFLRGFFFAAGRVSDPQKQYSLEFSPIDHHEKYLDLINAEGISLKSTTRRGVRILYLHSCDAIESFFALANLNSVAFAFMNAKIEGEFRNNINRGVNCETNNITRAVNVSQRHVRVIKRLIAANMLSFLPEELQETALFRLENASLTLAQLAAISVPAISKSGLIHRLNRICEYAEQLLKDTGKK